MRTTFKKLRESIIKNGNSHFEKIDASLIIKLKLIRLKVVFQLEERKNLSTITMSFYDSDNGKYIAYWIENTNGNYKLFGETLDEKYCIHEIENADKERVLKLFKMEINNLV